MGPWTHTHTHTHTHTPHLSLVGVHGHTLLPHLSFVWAHGYTHIPTPIPHRPLCTKGWCRWGTDVQTRNLKAVSHSPLFQQRLYHPENLIQTSELLTYRATVLNWGAWSLSLLQPLSRTPPPPWYPPAGKKAVMTLSQQGKCSRREVRLEWVTQAGALTSNDPGPLVSTTTSFWTGSKVAGHQPDGTKNFPLWCGAFEFSPWAQQQTAGYAVDLLWWLYADYLFPSPSEVYGEGGRCVKANTTSMVPLP